MYPFVYFGVVSGVLFQKLRKNEIGQNKKTKTKKNKKQKKNEKNGGNC